MRAEPFAVLLSLILAFGPGVTPALADNAPAAPAQPLAERIAAAQKQLAAHLAGATLARADYDALEKEYQAAAGDDAARLAWGAFEPLAHRYNALRYSLISLDADGLRQELTGLSRGLSLPETGDQELLERYAQIKATLLQNGVSVKVSRFHDHDGKPMTDEQLAALLAKTLPARPNAELRASGIRDLQGLSEVREAIAKKDYAGAVDGLNRVLENMGNRPDLVQTGFGALPMQTALAMIQQTRDALPANYKRLVDTKLVDRQLLEVANKQIDVPSPAPKEAPRAQHEKTPFQTGVELSFYASLTGFPLVSHWAEKKLYAAQGTDLLSKDPKVAAFRYSEKAPDGAAKPGFYITYKDGSKRYESRDGQSVMTSKDGATVVEQNPGAGTFRQTVKGEEVLSYARGKDGVLRGKFRGRAFECAKRQQVLLSPDSQTLYVVEGFGKEGPNIKSWLGPDGERGRVLAQGLGSVVVHKDSGRVVKDIYLEPEALKKAVSGPLDLSPIGGDLDDARKEKFGKLLHDVATLGTLFKAAFGGETLKNNDGSSAVHGVEGAYIRDGRLTIGLTQQFNPAGKQGKKQNGWQIAVDLDPDGSLKAFMFKGDTVILWKFDPSQNTCDQFSRDVEAQTEGRTEFKIRARYQRQGAGWVKTGNFPIELKEWSWTDGVKSVGRDTLSAVGTVGEVAFSPFQSAHHYLHSGLVSAMGHGYGAATGDSDIGAWSDIDGVYSRRQATFNKWAGAGLDSQGERDSAYRAALDSAGSDQRRREFKGLLDSKVEEQRRAAYGELWRFHQNDPVTEQDRANAASTMFGLSNLANNYSQMADEQFSRGNTWSGVGLKGVKYFVIGGEMYVQGAGFGAAAGGLKTLAVGARYGLTAEQVASAAQRAALIEKGAAGVTALTRTEQLAVNSLKWIGRAETATFLAPAGVQAGGSLISGAQAWRRGDTKTALGHLDALLSNAAAFVLPMGLKAGEKFTNDAIVKYTQMKATDPVLVRRAQPDVLKEALDASGQPGLRLADKLLYTDSMTGLPNRGAMETNAETWKRDYKDPAVAVMDMNNFGAVNEGLISLYGPSEGAARADAILGKAGARLSSLAKSYNVRVARMGGEEFAVIGERADVMRFLEAAKLNFADGQALKDAGIAQNAQIMKAIKDATIRKGREKQSVGDFTSGVASWGGRTFMEAFKAADHALVAAKDGGGRGGFFLEAVRDGQLAYENAPDSLTAPERVKETEAKKARDEAVNAVQPGDVAKDIDDLRVLLGEDRFKKFKKVAFLDPLTQTRQYDFVRAEAPEWNKKYAKHGDASLISARGLKVINDALGHEAGDRYLTALGRELRKIVIDQRASGNWLEDAARIASKDFLIVGKDSGKVAKALDAAMRKVMAGDEVLDAAQKAKVAELAQTRGENPAMTGTLRAVKTRFKTGKGQADLFGTIDALIDLSDAAKQKEQPAPPAPPVVNSK